MDTPRFDRFVPVLIAALTALTAVAGWVVQRHREMQAEVRKTRQEIYVAYLTSLETERILGERTGGKGREELTSAEEQQLWDKCRQEKGAATARLAIFGETAVIEALAEHWRKADPRPCGEGWKTNLAFHRSMRESAMPAEKRVSDADLAELALRCSLGAKGPVRAAR